MPVTVLCALISAHCCYRSEPSRVKTINCRKLNYLIVGRSEGGRLLHIGASPLARQCCRPSWHTVIRESWQPIRVFTGVRAFRCAIGSIDSVSCRCMIWDLPDGTRSCNPEHCPQHKGWPPSEEIQHDHQDHNQNSHRNIVDPPFPFLKSRVAT